MSLLVSSLPVDATCRRGATLAQSKLVTLGAHAR